ncbi:DNA ligase D [Burkholderia mayonis]|uniref:DNA ligase (ATP) n=1 Tax=Burkholderia mayonis TaxID=1385591 RepID=A0A1B4FW39_9BURK|nr:DNA ligase D [Burkholderia mayonis]AOJ07876.1 DNA ligase [Burkholderia mayonis]KVE50170.1 DNA ligase [Burkholderia mayonis]
MAGKLDTYRGKRRFDETPEPEGARSSGRRRAKSADGADDASTKPGKRRRAAASSRSRHAQPASSRAQRKSAPLHYVIQAHHARHLHYDFRLELDGTLKSWAIPKGPSLDPSVKRLAVHVEDHPLEYGTFEGEIPEGHYGAGSVIVWDRGVWAPDGGVAAARAGYRAGKLSFTLDGDKLHGGWALVRGRGLRDSGGKHDSWLLIKARDDDARGEDEFDVLQARPESVLDKGRAASAKNGHAARTASKAAASRRKRAAASREPGADPPAMRSRASRVALAGRSDLVGARRADLPRRLDPQLATLVDAPPPGDDWLYEAKFDGYRVLIRIDRGAASGPVAVYTREGRDWTAKFARQVDALARLKLDRGWLDGEAVVLNRAGVPDFQALQNALGDARSEDVTLFLFDVPFLNGFDLRGVPLERRRALLAACVDTRARGVLRYSESFSADAADLLTSACDAGLEGLIGKRRDSRYVGGRSKSWVKLKCRRRQEFVIGGYTEPAGRRSGFGALLLGVYERAAGDEAGRDARNATAAAKRDDRRRGASRASRAPPLELRYVGRVGTGFDERTLRTLARTLRAHETGRMPFAGAPRERSGTPVHWVKPVLVAECRFAEWTSDAIVRQASFVGLREDKPARTIVREESQRTETKAMDERTDERARQKARNGASEATSHARRATRPESTARSTADLSARDVEHESTPRTHRTKRAASAKRAGADDRPGAPDEASDANGKARRGRKHSGSPTIAGVRISHPDRVIDPQTGARKLDLVEYWEWVAPWLLPQLKGRPVSLVRAPADIGGELFFQKHADKLEIPNVALHAGLDPGHEALITIDDVTGLIGAAQMGTIELHTWNAHVSNIEKPDRAVFDLDPDPSLDWRTVIEAAQLTHALLDELGLASFCKTSGGKGLHVVVPLVRHASWDDVKDFAQAVARHMAAALPERFTATMGPRNRKGRIFVDYLRNSRGASTIAAYSVRARPGLGVSVPIAWDELPETTGAAQWTLDNLHARLDALKRDPWRDYAHVRQRVTAVLRKRLSAL